MALENRMSINEYLSEINNEPLNKCLKKIVNLANSVDDFLRFNYYLRNLN